MSLRYEITWLDSGLSRYNGWETLVEVLQDTSLSYVTTLGYLLHEDEESYIFASSKAITVDKYYGIQVIAKKNIKSMVRLRER
jgi:hypothetical protein